MTGSKVQSDFLMDRFDLIKEFEDVLVDSRWLSPGLVRYYIQAGQTFKIREDPRANELYERLMELIGPDDYYWSTSV